MPRRKFVNSDKEPGGGWQIIYTGFILILLCFFIMLSSFATMEQSKIARFVRSFVDALSLLPSGMGFERNKEVVPQSKDIVDLNDELAKIFKELEAFRADNDLTRQLEITLTEEGLAMRLADKILFELGSVGIAPEARPLLDKIGSILARTRLSARIEGHTDNLPIATERYPSNWELSTARAVSVLRYLLAGFAIPSQRLSAAGYGEYQPLVSNDSEENRSRNRRVEIFLMRE